MIMGVEEKVDFLFRRKRTKGLLFAGRVNQQSPLIFDKKSVAVRVG
jgi:hypothetical protein